MSGRAGAGTDPLRRDDLERALASCRLGRPLELYETIGSTNARAKTLGQEGAAEGALVCATGQTAGRGRRGRIWASSPGGLYCSLLLRPEPLSAAYGAALQLAGGVAVAEAAAEFLPRRPELLWPNDCLHDGAKLAGVLVEAEGGADGIDFLVCGIGVNVNQSGDDFTDELRGVATSLRMASGVEVDRAVFLGSLMEALARWERVARREGPSGLAPRWEELSPTARDHDVEVEAVEGTIRGRSAGLGPNGGLLVVADGRSREILLGELIRVRRKA